jgi:glycosidase
MIKKALLLPLFLLLFLAACRPGADGMGDGVAVTAVPETLPTAVAPDPTAVAPPPTPAAPPPTAAAPDPTAEPAPELAAAPWWQDAVFYEVFLRSFRDSDGDGIGDLNGLIERLDYLNDGDPATTGDLGVTALWLMPPMQSPSYHGYDVVDYLTVEEDYGSNEDFRRLIDEAHARGMRVIVDLVLNHTSDQHPWFQAAVADRDAPTRDYYLWADEAPAFRGPFGQDVWHESPTGNYYGLFWGGMPDLNYRNPQVTEEMFDVARFWLEEMGADGFRLDAVKYLVENEALLEGQPETHEWLADFGAMVRATDPEAYTIGEVWSPTLQAVKYVGDELDAVFEFDLAAAIMDGVNRGDAAPIARAQANAAAKFPPGGYAAFLSNHDQNRVMSQFIGDEGRARLGALLLLTGPGTPFIYYGEEIGQSGVKPDEDIRLPLQWDASDGAGFSAGTPWRPPYEDYETRNIAAQTAVPDSLLSLYRDLIRLRQAHPALRAGAWTAVESNERGLYAFLRHDETETLLVLLNLDDEPAAPLLALEEGPLVGGETAVLLFDSTAAAPAPALAAPDVTAAGGFAAYQPVPEIAAQSGLVIALE